jgi:DNA-binding IclR family transcriptional regulator
MCAALCVAGVALRISRDKIGPIVKEMLEMARSISAQLGYQGK